MTQKFSVFIPNEAGGQGLLELLRFTGAIQGFSAYPDGLSISLPSPMGVRAKLWADYCKEKGLVIGEHFAAPLPVDSGDAPPTTPVPDGNQEPEVLAYIPPTPLEGSIAAPLKKKVVRRKMQ